MDFRKHLSSHKTLTLKSLAVKRGTNEKNHTRILSSQKCKLRDSYSPKDFTVYATDIKNMAISKGRSGGIW